MLKAAILLATACSTLAATLNVPGTANPWLAGMTNGFSESSGDVTPAESPVLFTNFISTISITAGAQLRFAVSGSAGYAVGAESGAEGVDQYFVTHPAELGIGAINNSLANALLGVFLDDSQADPSAPTPAPYDFGSTDSRNYLELRPKLNQPFYIGDGVTTNGIPQIIVAPSRATRLFLGITDGSGWYNNTGSFAVDITVAPPPVTYALTLSPVPTAGGSIAANPGPGADGKYAVGTDVTLTATAIQGYYLQSWTGVDTFNGDTAQILMSGPRSVTASFTLIPADNTNCGCPIECLDQLFSQIGVLSTISRQTISQQAPPSGQIDLTLLRTFRDQVLARSTQGQSIIDIFYKFSAEITFHFATSSDLRTIAVQAILNLQPLLRDMVAGTGELTMSSNQVNAVNALVGKLHEVSGVDLKSALQIYRDQAGSLENLVGKTSAQVRFFLGIQIQIVNPKINSIGGLEFTVTGVLPSGTLHAEYSDDLAKWNVLSLAPVTTLPATVRDDQPFAAKQRYYRVVVVP